MDDKERIIPSIIEDNEPLLRAISTPSCLDSEKRATHLAFRLRNNERGISLSRAHYEDLISFIKRAIRFDFTFLSSKDVTSGAIELIAKSITTLDEHIVLEASASSQKQTAHANIFFKKEDGTNYSGGIGLTTDPVDASILGYEMALASIVNKVYDKTGNVIWSSESQMG